MCASYRRLSLTSNNGSLLVEDSMLGYVTIQTCDTDSRLGGLGGAPSGGFGFPKGERV